MTIFLVCCGLFLLIIDPQSALTGAREGLELCVKTVIPSLLPFFFLSIILTNLLSGKTIPFLRPLGRLLRLPEGMESVFLIGILGGYPVGAQAVAQAAQTGGLDRDSAGRMLGFCSNAGPSFIFGILGGMFSSPITVWALWLLHILSAVLVGIWLPGENQKTAAMPTQENIAPTFALERSLRVMANVCGWVILFRVVISFLTRWLLWMWPTELGHIVIGALELANGCCMLPEVESEGARFVMAACFLAFGGCCVAMQTMAVTGDLGTGLYFPGKIMQTVISFLLAWGWQFLFFSGYDRLVLSPAALLPVMVLLMLMLIYLKKQKNNSSIPALSDV